MAVSSLEEKRSLQLGQVLALAAFAATLPVLPWLVMGPAASRFESFWLRAGMMALLALAGGALLKLSFPRLQTWEAAAIAFIAQGAAFRLGIFLPDLSTTPLTLGWSEASRYYYASLYLSKSLYGFWTPPSVLHPTRYLMQALPFLAPSLPIWVHRLWQVGLWIGFSWTAAYLLARRLKLQNHLWSFLVALWGFVFLFQGPVYYHLAVMIIAVLLGYNLKRPWQTLVVVIGTSLWAGVSRINWLPVPGMLASALYFLEEDLRPRSWLKYLSLPAAWTVLGTAAGFLSMKAYEVFSGNPPYFFGSSLTSDLLWYRLKPSPTYPLGVVLAVTLVSLPLALILVWAAWKTWGRVHILRILALAGMLAVLGAGGLIVSTKIGGGSNLHNMDAYLSLLMVVGAMVAFGRVRQEGGTQFIEQKAPAWMLFFAAAVPALILLTTGGTRWMRADLAKADAAVATIKAAVEPEAAQGGRILFISDRQLVTFGQIDVPLEPDYERVFLMEMAMADNQPYLERFYADLREHAFAQIVVQTQRVAYQGANHPFGEENDAWVKNVTEPLLCSYQPGTEIPEAGVTIYVPKQGAEGCP